MNRQTVMIDGLTYVIKGGVKTVPLTSNAIPAPVPQSGTPKTENLLSARQLEIRPPWGVGLLRGNDPHRVYSEKNMNSLFSLATAGPLQNTPTMTSPPATFKISPPGFVEALNTIFMYGSGGASGDEPVWYWVGSTTTWTNATVNADISGDMRDITGMAQIGTTVYAINRTNVTDSIVDRYVMSSVNKTTWATASSQGAADDIGNTSYSAYFLLAVSGKLRTLVYNDVDVKATVIEKDMALGADGRLSTAAWATVGTITLSEAVAPRGYVLWHDYAGVETTFIATNKGLYKGGTTPVRLHNFRNSRSAYTGRLEVGKDDRLYFLDGENIGRLTWTTGGGQIIEYLGPQSINSPSVGTSQAWDGLPLANQGAVTAMAYSKTQPWLHIGLGGLAASKNATWMVFEPNKPIEYAWHVPYENATAQRALTAMVESDEDDGIPRLHIVEEQAAGGTQSPRYFNYVTRNPKQETAYTYATAPVVRLSRMDTGLPIVKKVFDKLLLTGDDLTSTETVTVKFAKDGGTLGTGQAISASPGGKWAGVVGTHTGSNNASALTDSAAAFVVDGVTIGDVVYNSTDGSSGRITAVTATTVTAALAGGTDNDFDTNDVYYIPKGRTAYDLDAELTLARSGTTTMSAKIAALSIAYDIIVLKDNGTPLFQFGPLTISRNQDDYAGIERSAEQILADLYTSFAKAMLAFNYREGQTEVNTIVKMGEPLVVRIPIDASDSGPAANVGDIIVSLAERI